jgi:homogentisate 1,2-dioxygenase
MTEIDRSEARMPGYMRMGEVPRKRHTQFRGPDGRLRSEQLFGLKGFSGVASLIYHVYPPTQVADFQTMHDVRPQTLAEEPLRHRHLKTQQMGACGDPVSGRVPLFANEDVVFGYCRPSEEMDYFYKNADGDDLLYVHEGSGRLETMFGWLEYGPGDYLKVPRGTIYRLSPGSGETRLLTIEATSSIEIPRRYRNEYGQLLEHAPFCERDFRGPESLDTHDESGRFEVRIKARGRLNAYFYDHHPFDLVGWDGFVYPWAFNIRDFEPITGSLHMPPPIHQTFEAHNFVVCSFCPRMLDYHPEAVPVPYNHSNLESDELLFYCNDKFGSRKGIEVGSITLHPSGIPHGPQPGAVEASLGKTRTEELAVMLDTFRPLRMTRAAAGIEDEAYPFTWKADG